ncbi:class I SAM-dependent methyltransferase [Anaeromyxobacter terrae]|uniref:class I SAM-dependent methyltransferase n=1 Tax=Anaeromyxobacter terrae TaxID=2925406 RepID=UPI001F5AC583|nr:class I SAM-dependent methyltransferase [Anaeromyxobacter sp. SG22]
MEGAYASGRYLAGHPGWHVEDSEWKASQVLEALRRNRIAPRSVAEVGCGAGEILRRLQLQMPPETRFVGFDVSPDAIALCQQRANDRLQFILGQAACHSGEFDVLLMIDVIEHVEDYFGFLRELRPKARTKIAHLPLDMSAHGVLRRVPATSRRNDHHLHYFMKDTALAAFADCGYRVIDWFYTPKAKLPARQWRTAISNRIRRAGFVFAPDLVVRALGGYGLIVVAE